MYTPSTTGDFITTQSTSVCPACGYCPHCGRSNQQTYPYIPGPFWQIPSYPYWKQGEIFCDAPSTITTTDYPTN